MRVFMIIAAVSVLVSGGVIVAAVVAFDEQPQHFCTLGAPISTQSVELQGSRLPIGPARLNMFRKDGCQSFPYAVVLYNCEIWDFVDRKPILVRSVEPFYTDGTCNGVDGGSIRDDAPEITVHETPHATAR